MRAWSSTHCRAAEEKIRSSSPSTPVFSRLHSPMSRTNQVPLGWLVRADSIISAELSRPTMDAVGHRSAQTAVLFPGPQPRSYASSAWLRGTRARSSWEGRVRSSSKRLYRAASQSGIHPLLQASHLGSAPEFENEAAIEKSAHSMPNGAFGRGDLRIGAPLAGSSLEACRPLQALRFCRLVTRSSTTAGSAKVEVSPSAW